jgi:O-antigen/teichoic acid export membrane protein
MTDSAVLDATLKQRTAIALFWSALQTWSVRVLALILFFFLAKFLSPTEVGMAQTVTLLLALAFILSEQGYHAAIIQTKELHRDDVNLPFYVSVGLGLLMSAGMLLGAQSLAELLGKPEIVGLIRLAAIVPPMTAATGFLVAMSRRTMDFRRVAVASFISGVLSSALAMWMAASGYGPASLVAQAIASGVLTALVIWSRPSWLPGRHLAVAPFKRLSAYGWPLFFGSLVDFLSSRLIDFVILTRFGLVAFGIYTVGAKLYQTLLDLFTASMTEVVFSAFSKIIDAPHRLRHNYFRVVFLASCGAVPLFVLVASLAPEICGILFGSKWSGSERVLMWLSLLGSVQIVLNLNASVIGAGGRPRLNLLITAFRLVCSVAGMAWASTQSVETLAIIFAGTQLLAVPLSYWGALGVTGASLIDLLKQVLPGLLSASVAFVVVALIRHPVEATMANLMLRSLVFGSTFSATYLLSILLISGPRLRLELRDMLYSFPVLRRWLGAQPFQESANHE